MNRRIESVVDLFTKDRPVKLEDVIKIRPFSKSSWYVEIDFSGFNEQQEEVRIAYGKYTSAVNTAQKALEGQAALHFQTLTGFSAQDLYEKVQDTYAALGQQTIRPTS